MKRTFMDTLEKMPSKKRNNLHYLAADLIIVTLILFFVFSVVKKIFYLTQN